MKDAVATLFVHMFYLAVWLVKKSSEIICLLLHFRLNESKQESIQFNRFTFTSFSPSDDFDFIVND